MDANKKAKAAITSAHKMKYLQLAEYISEQIESDQLKIDSQIPSLQQLMTSLKMSKETVLKGLNYLSEKGIIESVYRKGYYVKKKAQYHPYRIFFLLDKMNILRDRIYSSFFEETKSVADIDIYFHHHNLKLFKKLIEENINNYTHFVITTFFRESVTDILNAIPPHKRIILDFEEKGLTGDYTCIYQDFKADIVDCLTELQPRIKNYQQLILIAPKEAYHAKQIIDGFTLFCKKHQISGEIETQVNPDNFKAGNMYITFGRYDLDDIEIIKLVRQHKFELGKEIGLLSYNDTAVKEVLENGITVISTDFKKMGQLAAKSIIDKQTIYMRDPATVILRNSL